MPQTETVKFSGIEVSQQFSLRGGVYLLAVAAAAFGTVALQIKGADGSYVTVNQSGTPVSFAQDGTSGPLWLPPGDYQLTVTGAAGVDAVLSAVPPQTVL